MNFRLSIDLQFRSSVLFFLLCIANYGYAQETTVSKMQVLNGITSVKKTDQIQAVNWMDFKHPEGAFTIKMPGKPEEVKKEVPNASHPGYPPYVLNMYIVVDSVNLITYLVRYNDYPAGLYLADKSLAFNAVITELEGKGKIVKAPTTIFKDGNEGRKLDLSIENFYLQIEIYVRGNRIYLLLKQTLKDEPLSEDDFFNSFHFDKYNPNKGIAFSVGNINLIMPEEPFKSAEHQPDESSYLQEDNIYFATNKNSGGVYAIENGALTKYTKIKDLDSIYAKVPKETQGEGDSLYKFVDFQIGDIKGKEYYSVNKRAGTEKRSRVWIKDGQFYYQTAKVNNEEILNGEVDNFFNSVKVKAGAKSFDLKSSKAALIMEDLKNKDTLVSNAAHNALNNYDFDKSELPIIYAALKNKYVNDTAKKGTKTSLIKILTTIYDEHTVGNLKAVFEDKSNPDLIRVNALVHTTDIDKNNYDWYFNSLLSSKPFDLENHWLLFAPLRDSLSYSAEHIDKLVGLLDVPTYREDIVNVFSNMLYDKEKTKYKSLIQLHKRPISAKALEDLNLFLKEFKSDNKKKFSYILYNYLNILPNLDSAKLADEFTNKLLAVDSLGYLHRVCMAARIKTGLALNKEMLNSQLDSLDSRYQIMEAFYEAGKIKAVPQKYRKHDEFAKLLLCNYISEEYDYPESIQLTGVIKESSGTYYAFDFSHTEDGVKKVYIGVVGPFGDQAEELKFDTYKSFSDFEPKEADWQIQAKGLIAELNEK